MEIKIKLSEMICPICGAKMSNNPEPLMVCTRQVKDAIYWDINVYQFCCDNGHDIYFNPQQ
jgi:hypothetical protein